MKNISIKDLVDFRRKSTKSKMTFVYNLGLDKKMVDGSGGDYWISSISTLSNIFRYNDSSLLDEKIEILLEKIESTTRQPTVSMYQRNINILNGFTDFEIQSIKPTADLNYIKKSESRSLIDINGLQIKATPNHVYSFNSEKEIGAVWYVAKLHGFNKFELGMFADMLYRYLLLHFSKDYFINPTYCVAIDAIKANKISYEEINNGKIPAILDKTVDEIKRLM